MVNNFLLTDATDSSKISSDQKWLFFANTPFNLDLIPSSADLQIILTSLQYPVMDIGQTLEKKLYLMDKACILKCKNAHIRYWDIKLLR